MNELIFALVMLLSLAIPMVAARFGYTALVATGIFLTMMTFVLTGYIVTIFGLAASVGVAFFASIFLLTDIIGEMYGPKKAFQTVLMTVTFNICAVVLGVISISMIPLENTAVTDGIASFFSFIPRLLVASIIAYGISQSIDVFLFAQYKKWTQGKYLWLRNSGSTLISQFIDTGLFVSLAFYGLVSNDVLTQLFITVYGMKVVIALLDTPFCYLGRWLVRKNKLKDGKTHPFVP